MFQRQRCEVVEPPSSGSYQRKESSYSDEGTLRYSNLAIYFVLFICGYVEDAECLLCTAVYTRLALRG